MIPRAAAMEGPTAEPWEDEGLFLFAASEGYKKKKTLTPALSRKREREVARAWS